MTGESQRADQVDDAKVPGAKRQCRLICRHRNGARGRWSWRMEDSSMLVAMKGR